jgi:hypothetical protein
LNQFDHFANSAHTPASVRMSEIRWPQATRPASAARVEA